MQDSPISQEVLRYVPYVVAIGFWAILLGLLRRGIIAQERMVDRLGELVERLNKQ